MTLFRTALLTAALGGTTLAAMAAAQAQPIDGLYVGAGAGYNILQDLTATVEGSGSSNANGVTASAPMRVKWGGGYLVSGSIGWGFGNGFRLELEGDFRSVDQRDGGPGGNGRQIQFGVMGNALYDLDVGLDWVSPYVGVGIGYQAVSWNRISGVANGLGGGGTGIGIDQTLGGFAYQFIAGLSFPIDQVPGLSVTAEYRYMNLAGGRNYRATGNTPSVAVHHAHVGGDASHSILVGLRYAFDTPDARQMERPPPAPPPPPAPDGTAVALPARTYLVFFDWDSAALTPRAREIIGEAVRNSVGESRTRIEVTGHADRSGTARGNQALSLRRAEAVAAELRRRGVPADSIDIHAAGDTRPLVPTAAGVRQPENRRVEIVYR